LLSATSTAELLARSAGFGPRTGHFLGCFTSDPGIYSIRNLLVTLARRVLVDERSPHAPVAHPVHQFPLACAAGGRQDDAGMPQIVKVEPIRQTGVYDQLGPLHQPMKVVAPRCGPNGPPKISSSPSAGYLTLS
jgi:hypothetical protein